MSLSPTVGVDAFFRGAGLGMDAGLARQRQMQWLAEMDLRRRQFEAQQAQQADAAARWERGFGLDERQFDLRQRAFDLGQAQQAAQQDEVNLFVRQMQTPQLQDLMGFGPGPSVQGPPSPFQHGYTPGAPFGGPPQPQGPPAPMPGASPMQAQPQRPVNYGMLPPAMQGHAINQMLERIEQDKLADAAMYLTRMKAWNRITPQMLWKFIEAGVKPPPEAFAAHGITDPEAYLSLGFTPPQARFSAQAAEAGDTNAWTQFVPRQDTAAQQASAAEAMVLANDPEVQAFFPGVPPEQLAQSNPAMLRMAKMEAMRQARPPAAGPVTTYIGTDGKRHWKGRNTPLPWDPNSPIVQDFIKEAQRALERAPGVDLPGTWFSRRLPGDWRKDPEYARRVDDLARMRARQDGFVVDGEQEQPGPADDLDAMIDTLIQQGITDPAEIERRLRVR